MTPRLASALIAVALFAGAASAEPEVASCGAISELRKPAKEVWTIEAFGVLAMLQESKGEASFRLDHATPAAICEVERFDAGEHHVRALRASGQPSAESTLRYRFEATGSGGGREILVIFEPLASVRLDAGRFYAAEMRGGRIAYIAIWKREPAYQAARAVVAGILDGSRRPVVALEWPPGARGPLLHAVDTSRRRPRVGANRHSCGCAARCRGARSALAGRGGPCRPAARACRGARRRRRTTRHRLRSR
jgi:hypothetical protein